jgi:RNA polymerase sigma factor (sigma-70 family)
VRAFDSFYETYWSRVRGYAAREFGEAYADDIAQEAMLRAYRSFHQLDPDRSATNWLYGITRHAGLDVVKAARRYVATETDTIDAITGPTVDHPAVAAVAGDTRRRLGRALQRLTDHDRTTLQLFDVEGRPASEIAALYGTTANTIRQRLFRARRHLLREFEAVGGQPGLTGTLTARLASWHPNALGRGRRALDSLPAWVRDHAGATACATAALLVLGGPSTTAPRPPATAPRSATTTTPTRDGVPLALPPLTVPRPPDALGRASSTSLDVSGLGRLAYPYSRAEDCDSGTRSFRLDCVGVGAATPVVPPGATSSTEWIRSADGTSLKAEVLLPAAHRAGQRHPVILVTGPSPVGGHYAYPQLWQDGHVFERGYAYVQVALRGRGDSKGCADLGGPGEQADVRAAIAWAASRPWSTGSVGMWGVAYDGWAAVMGLASSPPGLAAVVAGSPLTSLHRGLYDGGVRLAGGGWAFATATCSPGVVNELARPEADRAFWRERDLTGAAGRSSVPVLLSHGFADPAAPVAGSVDLLSRLRGPHRAFLGQYDLGFPRMDDFGARWFGEAMNWLDRYVAKRPAPVRTGVVVEERGPDGADRWRERPAWPPADAATLSSALLPGSYTDAPGNCGRTDVCWDEPVSAAPHTAPRVEGRGAWTFGQPLPYDVHLAGAVRVRLRRAATPVPVPVVCLLYDVDDADMAHLVTRGAVTGTGGALDVVLDPQDWRLPADHRLALLVTGADDGWYLPDHTGLTTTVDRVEVVVPYLRADGPAPVATFDPTPAGWFRVDVADDRVRTLALPPRLR